MRFIKFPFLLTDQGFIADDHKVESFSVQGSTLDVPVISYPEGKHSTPVYRATYTVPLSVLSAADPYEGIADWLVSAEGPFAGGWTSVPVSNEDLTPFKNAAIAKINSEAEAARMRFLTPGMGQALTYQRKETEARAWTINADPENFPFLKAEADATGMRIAEVAAQVVAQADAWIPIGAAIDGLRRGAVVGVERAETLTEIDAAAKVGWPS